MTMIRAAILAYGVVCHVLFLAVFAWMALFVGGLVLARTIDAPAAGFSWSAALLDLGLIALFAVPHSVMARPRFKARWTRFVPSEIERSTYVLIANACMIALLLLWQPFGPTIWDVQAPVGRAALWALFGAGWLLVPLASLLINHFDLFGTRQVWLHFRGRAYSHLPFRTPGLYRFVRHPLYVGWMTAFWATPTMSAGHLLFAAGMTLYMLLAIPHEERDLLAVHGAHYENYSRDVPALLPRWRPSARAARDIGQSAGL
jgi:protein-S-isoprenylcysteine O-methyltransferase Ste14